MMSATASEMKRPVLWTPGDWNAFFGFGTNILVNMLVLTGLLRFVLKMPDSLVFGRILPALGLMMCLSTMYYAFLAYRLALKTGRSDCCGRRLRGIAGRVTGIPLIDTALSACRPRESGDPWCHTPRSLEYGSPPVPAYAGTSGDDSRKFQPS